ncbi:HipA family kinase [Kribbella sp. CA-293567]|uniref:HipA family kinase n=1 Tax=Kribbella sp. CA-293567 TaxID=3002436 RepID=UPI003FA5F74C
MTAGQSAWSDAAVAAALDSPGRARAQAAAQVLIKQAETGSKPILASADDQQQYWLKWPGNPHGNLSLAHEVLVAGIGRLLGAPVRRVSLIYVDPALVIDQFVDGQRLPAGLYAGSELLTEVEEDTVVARVRRADNAARFAYYLALWDLCLGTDLQLLYHLAETDQVWSIDHGLWFDSLEGDWSAAHLSRQGSLPWPWPDGARPQPFSRAAFLSAGAAVDGLTCQDLADVLGGVPLEWGIADETLRTLARFVYERRSAVSERLRQAAAWYR